jgi:hypothetical protein
VSEEGKQFLPRSEIFALRGLNKMGEEELKERVENIRKNLHLLPEEDQALFKEAFGEGEA